ncbi:MAG TPA: PEP-CTERM sorting domain-containing protein [Thermoguttaceae bacterium]|nr:PEP-CTERM sorting domain-containing protein [Thermoguttaceae bacterium]
MDLSTGDLNYVKPHQSLLFAFFDTATGNAVEVTGFAVDWRDLDAGNGGTAGSFTIRDKDGNATILNTNSPVFTLGSSLTHTNWDVSNGVNPDAVYSSGNGDWNNTNLAFITDLSETPIHSFSLDNTTDWIAPTSLRLELDISTSKSTVNPIPEPATLVVWSVLGAIALAFGYRRRKAA